MKLGFCALSWADLASDPRHPLTGIVKAAGYDGVEVPITHGEPRDFLALGKSLRQQGLEATSLTVIPHGMNPISADPAQRAAAKARIAWVLECAEALGARLLVGPVHQTLNEFTGLPPSDAEFERLRDFHRHAGQLAAARGIVIAVEAMNRFEAHMFNTMDGLAQHIEAVGHPAITGMYDTFHANIEETDPPAALHRQLRHVGHFHVSESDRGVPGRGHVPWIETFGVLKRGGYEGWLTVESFSRANPEIAAATRVWRDLSGGAEDACGGAIDFIRSAWAKA